MIGRRSRRTLTGWVVSDRMDKTVSVRVERRKAHPLYEKVLRREKTLKAHDEKEEARVGDRVLVMETRPLSKTKRWRLVQILDRAPGRAIQREDEAEMQHYQEVGRKPAPAAGPAAAPVPAPASPEVPP